MISSNSNIIEARAHHSGRESVVGGRILVTGGATKFIGGHPENFGLERTGYGSRLRGEQICNPKSEMPFGCAAWRSSTVSSPKHRLHT
jgi:hypothetical protein